MNWEDPGPKKSENGSTGPEKRVKWVGEAQALRENPKRWAKLTTKPSVRSAGGMVHQVNNGKLRAFRPAGHFQATARGTDVYVRYVGEVT